MFLNQYSANKIIFPNIQNLLYYLFRLTRANAKIFTPDSLAISVLIPFSVCDSLFCKETQFIKDCLHSTLQLFHTINERNSFVTECSNGLNKAAFPIRIYGKTAFIIVIDGFFFEDEAENRTRILAAAMERGHFKSRNGYDAVAGLPAIKRAAFEAVSRHCISIIKNIENAFECDRKIFETHSADELYRLETLEKKFSAARFIKEYLTVLDSDFSPALRHYQHFIGPAYPTPAKSLSEKLAATADPVEITIFKSADGDSILKESDVKLETLSEKYIIGKVVGKSEYMKAIFETLHFVSASDSNVLIEGPSGTGKSLIAKSLHSLSERRDGPFIVVNCGAIPETLLESELFGYVKGAFTDAKKDKPGKFHLADNGTIFLDEIGELPINLQVKLLRVIEEKNIEPLGSTQTIKINFRLITATNKNLKELVAAGKFREDLFYRLRVAYYNIPALRERREDIGLLTVVFIEELNAKYGKNIAKISGEVNNVLKYYDFPGNARELYNMLEHAYIFCKSDTIVLKDLPDEFASFHSQINNKDNQTAPSPESSAPNQKKEPDDTFRNFTNYTTETKCKKNTISREELIKILTKYMFNKSKTAKSLNISRMTLWRLMKNLGITDKF